MKAFIRATIIPLLIIFLTIGVHSRCYSQVTLLKDLFPSNHDVGSYPGNFTILNNVAYFSATTFAEGNELWRTDGTAAGTFIVKDINPGRMDSKPQNLLVMNGVLYFIIRDNGGQSRLWKSDGTASGTISVQNDSPLTAKNMHSMKSINGMLYFDAYDDIHGTELWKSDGTESGTMIIKDIRPGTGSSISYYPKIEIEAINGYVCFSANDGVNGEELWRTDGTEAGTIMIKDVEPGSFSSQPKNLLTIGNTLYFSVYDSNYQAALWKTDGTTLGTVMVSNNLITPNNNGGIDELVSFNGLLYFTSFGGLWKSDGTTLGTTVITDNSIDGLDNIVIFNNSIYFSAFKTGPGATGEEIFKSDGTTAGTVILADIVLGANGSSPSNFRVCGNTLYFQALNSFGRELWKTNGLTSGTVMVKNINNSLISSDPREMTYVNGVTIFSARTNLTDTELWMTDGTAAGTEILMNIFSNSLSIEGSEFIEFKNKIYFSANTSGGSISSKLCVSDGTTAGTTEIASSAVFGNPIYLTVYDDNFYFSASTPAKGIELYKSNGTAAGTSLFKDFYPGPSSSSPQNLHVANGFLFFTVNTHKLYKTNGSYSGTVLIKNVDSYGSVEPENFININGTIYFNNGCNLWKSDGTTAGTSIVKTFANYGRLYDLINLNGTLYFNYGGSLWKSDGTNSGTAVVKNILVSKLIVFGNKMYFSASDPINGLELWESDGTSAGTNIMKDIYPGAGSGSPKDLTNVNGVLYFSANNGINGVELWRSDGTSLGTVMVQDIIPGAGSSYPVNLRNAQGTLYFSATDGTNGHELWKSNGTSCNTILVDNINPGNGGSFPKVVAQHGNDLLMIAYNNSVGAELFKYQDNQIFTQSGCNSYTWSQNNQTYFSSGIYQDTLQSALGCDSVVTLNLTIYPATSSTTVTACNSYTWAKNGISYSSSGQYIDTIINLQGCSSIDTLNLTLNVSPQRTITKSACITYTWPLTGTAYTTSGQYSAYTINQNGCDSLIILDLTINQNLVLIENVTACNAYEWSRNNYYYTQSGQYTTTFSNSSGCDSVIILNLSINIRTYSHLAVTECNSYTLPLNGDVYLYSGLFEIFIGPNTVGCDSTLLLDLTITNPSIFSLESVCNSPYVWPQNGIAYSLPGHYFDTVFNPNGCNVVSELYLYIGQENYEWKRVANSYTWPVNGVTYTTSGSYPYNLGLDYLGCDSIIILDLTIYHLEVNTFSLPSDVNSCTGGVSIYPIGTPDFTFDLGNGQAPVTSSGYAFIDVTCGGIYSLFTTDGNGDTLSTTVVIPMDSNYIFNNPFIDSLAVDSLGLTIEDCTIYYNSIDTAYINSIFANGNQVTVIWNIVDQNGSNYDTSVYVLNNGNGVYYLQISFFCPIRSMGQYFSVTQAIYFGPNGVSIVGIEEKSIFDAEIFPNPTSDNVSINFNDFEADLSIYDTKGRLISIHKIENGQVVSLKEFESGIYLFDLKTTKGRMVRKVMKN